MKRTITSMQLTVSLALLLPLPALAQRSAGPDPLSRMVGNWKMTGTVRARPVEYQLEARRTLGGRFVQLHMKDVATPPAYEALVYIGRDSVTSRYVVHWLDIFGAGFSRTLGEGVERGDTLIIDFKYPDGPFRDTFTYDPSQDRWHFLLESGSPTGAWTTFAEYRVQRERSITR